MRCKQFGRPDGISAACWQPVSNLLNPSVIVIGGSLAETGEHLLAGVREVVYHRSPPLATQHLRISRSHTGARAGVRGASAMVIESVLAPEAIDALLAGRAAVWRASRRLIPRRFPGSEGQRLWDPRTGARP